LESSAKQGRLEGAHDLAERIRFEFARAKAEVVAAKVELGAS
jgi:hypothetical protein